MQRESVVRWSPRLAVPVDLTPLHVPFSLEVHRPTGSDAASQDNGKETEGTLRAFCPPTHVVQNNVLDFPLHLKYFWGKVIDAFKVNVLRSWTLCIRPTATWLSTRWWLECRATSPGLMPGCVCSRRRAATATGGAGPAAAAVEGAVPPAGSTAGCRLRRRHAAVPGPVPEVTARLGRVRKCRGTVAADQSWRPAGCLLTRLQLNGITDRSNDFRQNFFWCHYTLKLQTL